MRLLTSILICLSLISCSTQKSHSATDCIENQKFKLKYHSSIKTVEDYVTGNGNKKLFDSSLKFISKFTHVSYDKMLNYNRSYTTYDDFNKDKTEWLNWYEKNKCSNIKSR